MYSANWPMLTGGQGCGVSLEGGCGRMCGGVEGVNDKNNANLVMANYPECCQLFQHRLLN